MAVKKKTKTTDPAVLERMAKARAARGKKADLPEVFTATGIGHCRNPKWITAELGREVIKIRMVKYIKDPKRKVISCIKIEEPNFYEQIL